MSDSRNNRNRRGTGGARKARQPGKGGKGGGSGGYAKKGQSQGRGRSDKDQGRSRSDKGRRDHSAKGDRRDTRDFDEKAKKRLPPEADGLPRFVVEALVRVTPPKRQNAALAALGAAAAAFSEGQYHQAVRKADHAKSLASRDATIREVLGLASYRVGDWATALRELRTYRRLSGETTHMPVEMDALRALGRDEDVASVWQEFRKLGGGPAVKKEARVVFASFLIDEDRLDEAQDLVGKVKLGGDPWPEDLRLWYVAARVAALRGERSRARQIADALVVEDPSFPGLDDLDRLIDAI